ncbi:MAG: hypothetical protein HY317_03860 [Acidobacteria bacterium]|nr:hypothetical protein [Acidobacteriota bacterium]
MTLAAEALLAAEPGFTPGEAELVDAAGARTGESTTLAAEALLAAEPGFTPGEAELVDAAGARTGER